MSTAQAAELLELLNQYLPYLRKGFLFIGVIVILLVIDHFIRKGDLL